MVGHPAVRARPAHRKALPTKGEARRGEIIKAATRLFREKGYHATSMQDIADQVGLRKGSLYYHVASKEDLLFQIMDQGVTAALRELEDICARDLSPPAKLRRAVHSLVGALADQGERVTVFFRELRSLRPEQVEIITLKRKRYEALFRQILEEGQRQGLFELSDPQIASYGLLGMCNWIHQWYRAEGSLSPREIGQMFTELFLWGCVARAPRRLRRGKESREVRPRESKQRVRQLD